MYEKNLHIIFSDSKIANYIENDIAHALIISTNPNGKYQDLISNKQAILNDLHSAALSEIKEFGTTSLECFLTDELNDKLEEKLDFSDVEIIYFSISSDDLDESMDEDEELYIRVKKYIANNKMLENKKILLGYVNMDDFQKLDKLFKYFSDANNVYVELEHQIDLISIPDLKKVLEKIDEMVDIINKKEYSPMEKLIYTYDLVRKREYKKESAYENPGLSRDLNSVLFGDDIVCAGFSNICNIILNKLDIKSKIYKLIPKEEGKRGHARNVIRLKDEKYGIDGVYFLDTTFDSKKNKNNDYLYSYKYFCKPYSFFDGHNTYENEYEWVLEDLDSCIYEYLDFGIAALDASKLQKLGDLIKKINGLSRFLDGKNLLKLPIPGISKKEFKKKINEYKRLFNNPISAEKFLKAVEVVRKDEYLSEPDKYPYGLNAFYCILLNSEFDFKDYLTEEEKFYQSIFRETLKYKDAETKKRNLSHKIINFSDDTGFGKEAEQIRLVKVLNELKNKTEN